jgi:hypothetical protein
MLAKTAIIFAMAGIASAVPLTERQFGCVSDVECGVNSACIPVFGDIKGCVQYARRDAPADDNAALLTERQLGCVSDVECGVNSACIPVWGDIKGCVQYARRNAPADDNAQ